MKLIAAFLFAAAVGMYVTFDLSHTWWRSCLLERQLMEYDRSTVKLVWTEKTGGERGGK